MISKEKGHTNNYNDIYVLLRQDESFMSETWIVLHDSIEKRWDIMTMMDDILVVDV